MSGPAPSPTYAGLTARQRVLAAIALSFANFMVILDLTIANVSVPHIAGELGITLDQGTWVITSYAVAEAICVPLTGWLAQRFGSVRVFVGSLVGFGLFSLLCGSSVTLGMLVACRIGQGLCGAPIMPMSQALMVRIFPPEKRTTALGYWSMTVMVAPALGPILGGAISDSISWHWIFLINVPIAAVLAVVTFMLLRSIETQTAKVPIDAVGLGLLVFWVGCLQIVLDIGRDRDWFGDPLIVALSICAAVGFVAFLIWEMTDDHPVVDLRIFRYRAFTMAVMPFGLAYGGMFCAIVIIPQWLQASLGYSATAAGTVMAFQALSGVAVSGLIGTLTKKFDLRLLMAAGIAWMGIVSLMRAGWTSDADYASYAIPMFLIGLGIPFMAVPLTTMSLSAVPPDKVPSAAGLQTFIRTLALAFSTSVSVSYWGNAARADQTALVAGMHPEDAQSALAGAGLGPDSIRAVLAGMVDKEAVTLAMNEVFRISALIFAVAAVIVLFAPRPKIGATGGGGH